MTKFMIFQIIAIFFAFTVFAFAEAPKNHPANQYDFQGVVKEIQKLHMEAKMLPEHFRQKNPSRDGTEFNPNQYFNALKHLSMEKGYVLDYVYFFDGMGGAPYLYARKVMDKPFQTFNIYTEAVGGIEAVRKKRKEFLALVKADGSPESFFEFVVLNELAGQFYLHWHSNYFDIQVVTTPIDIQRIIGDWVQKKQYGPITKDQQDRAEKINPQPIIRFENENKVTVSIVTFSKWGGFFKRTYTISRTFPHEIGDVVTIRLVELNCGIRF